MIEREVMQGIADVDYTDDCRVKVWLRKRRTTMTVTEAKAFRSELDTAIAEAERGLADLLAPTVPPAFDQLEPIGPDCQAGKHPCDGGAWDEAADVEVRCVCPCHPWAVSS